VNATIARRPIGGTIFALILGWLSVGGFGNALVWRSARASFQVPESSPLGRFLEAASSPFFSLLALAYGATALVACIGIWRMRSWMTNAFLAWGVVVIILGVWMVWAMPSELLLGGSWVGVIFVLACSALLWSGYRYLQRIVPRDAL
jgi:hypothetical protein